MSNTPSPQGVSEFVEQVRSYLAQNPSHGRYKIAEAFNVPPGRVGRALRKIRDSKYKQAESAESGSGIVKLEEGRNDATASCNSSQITSVEQLLRETKVDLNVWEVERQTVNSYEVAMREPATTVGGAGDDAVIVHGRDGAKSTLWTRGSNKPVHERIFQIKVWLKRKTPQVTASESLLSRIEKNAPLLPNLPIRTRLLPSRRSLEICIMDVHLGLLCHRPEADQPWDLDLAAAAVLSSFDDLVKKAMAFGPFEEIFMPFGNDFVHCDNLDHTTTGGTNQPEAISWHHVYERAEVLAIEMVNRARHVAKKVYIYEIPGNHSRVTDFTLSRLIRAYFRNDPNIFVDASSSPYKFHRFGKTLIGYEHGHSVAPIRLAALMANERRRDFAETEYREWHLGDQHRKGSSNPAAFEEQGVSVEYIPGLTAPNEWHRLKAFNHQKRGAMAWVYDHETGPVARFQHNISQYSGLELK